MFNSCFAYSVILHYSCILHGLQANTFTTRRYSKMGGQHHSLATLPPPVPWYHCTIGSVTFGDGSDGTEQHTPPRFYSLTVYSGLLYRLLHPCSTIKHKLITFSYTHNHTFSATKNSSFEKFGKKIKFISFGCSANSKCLRNNVIKINVQNKGKMLSSLSNMQR